MTSSLYRGLQEGLEKFYNSVEENKKRKAFENFDKIRRKGITEDDYFYIASSPYGKEYLTLLDQSKKIVPQETLQVPEEILSSLKSYDYSGASLEDLTNLLSTMSQINHGQLTPYMELAKKQIESKLEGGKDARKELYKTREEDRTLTDLYSHYPQLYNLVRSQRGANELGRLLRSRVPFLERFRTPLQRNLDSAAFETSDFKRAGGSNPSTREFEQILKQGINSGNTYEQNVRILVPKALNEAERAYKKQASQYLNPDNFSNVSEYNEARKEFIRTKLLEDPFVREMFDLSREHGIDVNNYISRYNLSHQRERGERGTPTVHPLVEELTEVSTTPLTRGEQQNLDVLTEKVIEPLDMKEALDKMSTGSYNGKSFLKDVLQLPIGMIRGLPLNLGAQLLVKGLQKAIKAGAFVSEARQAAVEMGYDPDEVIRDPAFWDSVNATANSLDYIPTVDGIIKAAKDLGIVDLNPSSELGEFLGTAGIFSPMGQGLKGIQQGLTHAAGSELLQAAGMPAILADIIGASPLKLFRRKGNVLNEYGRPKLNLDDIGIDELKGKKVKGRYEDIRNLTNRVNEGARHDLQEVLQRNENPNLLKDMFKEEQSLRDRFQQLESEASGRGVREKNILDSIESKIEEFRNSVPENLRGVEDKEILENLENLKKRFKPIPEKTKTESIFGSRSTSFGGRELVDNALPKGNSVKENQLVRRIRQLREKMSEAYDPTLSRSAQNVKYRSAKSERDILLDVLKKENPTLGKGLENALKDWRVLEQNKVFSQGLEGIFNPSKQFSSAKDMIKDKDWQKSARFVLGDKGYGEVIDLAKKLVRDESTLNWLKNERHSFSGKYGRYIGLGLDIAQEFIGRLFPNTVTIKELTAKQLGDSKVRKSLLMLIKGIKSRSPKEIERAVKDLERLLNSVDLQEKVSKGMVNNKERKEENE